MRKNLFFYLFLTLLFLSGCKTSTSFEQDTQKPVIQGLDTFVLTYELGSPQPNWLEGVSASDNKDGNLTSQITFDASNVKMDKVGTYSITYTVSDQSGNSTTETLSITVRDTTGPIFYGLQDVEIEVFADTEPNFLDGVTASDLNDGDLTAAIKMDKSQVNYDVVGEYKVYFDVSDLRGNKTLEAIYVNVIDSTKPILLGLHPLSIEVSSGNKPNWLANVSATDNYDGNITSLIVVDDSNVNYDLPGDYLVQYSVTDYNGNQTTEQITLSVIERMGSRSRPVEFGNHFIIEDNSYLYGYYKIEVLVNSIKRGQEAEDLVLNENMFNKPSGYHHEYLLTNVSIKLLEIDETKSYYNQFGFENWGAFNLVTINGKMYDGLTLAVIPSSLNTCSLFLGESCSGNLINLIDADEEVLLKYKTTWFKTIENQSTYTLPLDESPNPSWGTLSNPVPFGKEQVIEVSNFIENYKVKVKINKIIRGQQAENLILNENMYNEPSGDTKEYILVNYTITLIRIDETKDLYKTYGFNSFSNVLVSKTGDVYDDIQITVIPNSLNNYALYLGGSATGNVVQLVDEGKEVLIKIGDTYFDLSSANIDNEKPVIHGLTNKTFEAGSSLPNFLNGITVSDNLDGDLTHSLTVDSSQVLMDKVGVYTVTFTVTDESGNTTTETVTVTIQDTVSPTFNGVTDRSIEVNQTILPNYLEYVSAYDECDGDVTTLIVVDSSEVQLNKIGKYYVRYSVSDHLGNTTTKTITVTVQDTIAPTIHGLANLTLEVNTTNLPDYYEFVFAYDEYDGELTTLIEVDSSGVNYNEVGDYFVFYRVFDSSGNMSIQLRRVIIIPTISELKVLNFEASQDTALFNEIVNFDIYVEQLEGFTIEKVMINYLDYYQFEIDQTDLKITIPIPVSDYEGNKLYELNSITYNEGSANSKKLYIDGNNHTSVYLHDHKSINYIYSVDDLNNIRNDLSGLYVLMNNLDLKGTNFEPIGSPFKGYFNGNGFTINNVSINQSVSTKSFIGLFAKTQQSLIKNLNLTLNYSIYSDYSDRYIGGLTGQDSYSAFENISVGGTITVRSTKSITGGIAGEKSGGYISRSSSKVQIDSTSSLYVAPVGGMVGYLNASTIDHSYVDTNIIVKSSQASVIAGGLVGKNSGTIQNSYAKVTITGETPYEKTIAKLVGVNVSYVEKSFAFGTIINGSKGNSLVAENYHVIENSFIYDGNLTGWNKEDYLIINSYSQVNVIFTLNWFTTILRFNEAIWDLTPLSQQKYPVLKEIVGQRFNRFNPVPDSESPVINGLDETPLSYELGSYEPNWLEGITASDNEDGDITSYLVVQSVLADMGRVGTYPVIYTVTDQAGNVTTETIYINIVDTTGPILSGLADITLEVNTSSTPDYLEFVTATDLGDGDLTANIVVHSEQVNMGVIGIYPVIYSVADQYGNTTTETITINIVDTTGPILSGLADMTWDVSVMTAPNYLEFVSATDLYDGDRTSYIHVNSENVTLGVIGTYPLIYTVTDQSGNTTTETVYVMIKDTLGPVFSGLSDVTLDVSVMTHPNYLEYVTATDYCDGERTSSIHVNFESVQLGVIGTYPVIYTVSDQAGNTSTETIHVHIEDTMGPVFSGLTAITLEANTTTIPNYYESVTAYDQYDGDLTELIQVDASLVNYNVIGDYTVIYQVTDLSGNTTVALRNVFIVQPKIDLDVLNFESSQETAVFDQIINLTIYVNQLDLVTLDKIMINYVDYTNFLIDTANNKITVPIQVSHFEGNKFYELNRIYYTRVDSNTSEVLYLFDHNNTSVFVHNNQSVNYIYTVDDLNGIRNNLTGLYVLMNDLDLVGMNWVPIGPTFKGYFNGNGYSINNISINSMTDSNIGLFASTSNSMIKNVSLNVNYQASNSNLDFVVGGLTGKDSYSGFERISITGQINVNSYRSTTGGIVGYQGGGYILNSSSTIQIDSKSIIQIAAIGGIVGESSANVIEGSFADVIITARSTQDSVAVGGLVGNNRGTINNSYAKVDITGEAVRWNYLGKLVGINNNIINKSFAFGNLTNSSRGNVLVAENFNSIKSSFIYDGNISGWNDKEYLVTNCYSQSTVHFTNDWFKSTLQFAESIWDFSPFTNNEYPLLRGLDGQSNYPY